LKVKVRYFTTLRELAGRSEEEVELRDGGNLVTLIQQVAEKYGKAARNYLYVSPENSELDPSIYFLVNGKNARVLSGPKTELKDSDIVAIIPPIGGG